MRRRTSGDALHTHGRAVSKYFGNALHHFRGVVTHANHGIGAMLASMLQKKLEGLFARTLAQIGEQSDIAAPNRLQRGPKIANKAARTHHNSANNPEIPHNPIPRQIHSASNHSRINSWHWLLLEEIERLMKPSYTTVDGCDSNQLIRAPRTIFVCYSLRKWKHSFTHWQSSRSCSAPT